MRRFRIVHALEQRLWIIPSLGVVAGIVLSLVTVAIDRSRRRNGSPHSTASCACSRTP